MKSYFFAWSKLGAFGVILTMQLETPKCLGVCVFVCALRLYPATPGWCVRCGCVCLGSGFGCAPPLLAGVLGCVGVCVRVPCVPRHSWLVCAVWVCLLGLGFRLRPSTPGKGVGVCVSLCARTVCTPPVLAGVCGVGVSAWARVFGCALPLLDGVSGCVCVCVRAPLVPRHSWRGCAVWVCVLGLGFRLRPATPSWDVGVCVCLCAGSAFTPPLLAGVCGVGGSAWAGVSAAPRHSWLGGWGVCLFVCAHCVYPASPGWCVRCGGVCLGSVFGCALPLLAGVLGCVCVCVRALLVPRHSWRGCAVWVCVLGLRFRLRPATPGWGIGVCVCLCTRSACTPPLLAGVCVVGVCAWARVSAAPCHSWLGCWGVCVFVCALCLYPAAPGWGVRCVCVCLRSGLGNTPPLLAVVLGCVCVRVRSPLVGPQLRAGLCSVVVCAWARVSAAPRHSWLGCWGVCVLAYPLRLYPASPGWGVRCGCTCSASGSGCAPPLLTGVLGSVCVCVRAPLVPRHSWLECAVWLFVLGLGFQLRPATPGWGVGVYVCSFARSACTPPLLAGVCGVGWGALPRVSDAPCRSWLGCWSVCVFVCALCLYPATPGWGVWWVCVCFKSGLGCAPPLLAGVVGCMCICVRAPLVPRHSCLECSVWLCVLGLGFRLRPATPGWGVGVCVSLCAHSPCTPSLLAGCCGVVVSALARVLAAPHHSWQGCWGVRVFVCALRSYPATPDWGVRCVCVCLGSHLGCAPPLLAGVLVCVCICVRAPLLPCHSWLEFLVWVCVLGHGFWLRPATPGGVLGCVCVCVPALLVRRHSLLGCALWVCVLGLGFRLRPATPGCSVAVWVCVLGLWFRLRPATPGWGVGVCVCLCAHFDCTPPFLPRVCGVGMCAWARALAAPRHSWLGCWGASVRVHPLLLPRNSWLEFVMCGLGVACHLVLCRGSLRVVRTARVCGPRLPLLLGTRPCASVVSGGVPLWRAFWPRVWAPRLVRSGRSRCSGRLSRRGGAFPRIYWTAARGTWRPAENRALCACRWPLPRPRRWAPSASYPFGAPRCGCFWRVPPATVLGCVRCGALACVDPVTDRSGFPYHSASDKRLSRCTRAVSCGRGHRPLRVRGRHARVPRVCACACPSWLGWAGRPPGRVLVRLTFTCGRSRCALCLLGPLQAGVALFAVVAVFLLFLLFSFPFVCSCCLWRSVFSGPGYLGPWRFVVPAPDPLFFRFPLFCFFSFLFCAPVVSGVPCFPAWGALSVGVLPTSRLLAPPFFSFFFLLLLPPLPPPCLFFFLACFSFVVSVFCSPLPPPPFFFFRAVTVVRCGAGLCVLGCGVCWCVLLGCCAPAGAGLRLICVVRCYLVVPVPCVLLPVVPMLAALLCAACGALFGCFVLWSCSARLRPVVALACCGGVVLSRRVLSCCSALRRCVLCWSLWFGVLPRCGMPCGFVRPPPRPPPACCALFLFWCALVVLPPRAGCGALCCALSCVVSSPAAVCGVLCVLPGAVWRACVGLGSCALLSGAVLCWVLLCFFCCVLLSRAAVFPAGFFFALLLAFPWCSGSFLSVWCSALVRRALRRALSRCVLVLVSAALCCLVLCCAMVRLLVLCCVVAVVAVLGSRLASSAAVAGCCALSVLGRGAVLSCCAARGLGAVFLVPCFRAPLSSWRLLCGAALACLRRCSPCGALSLPWRWLVLCVVACCVPVFAVGPSCPLLSPGACWCRVSVVRPCGLVPCVLVVRSPVLRSVMLCCRVVVCCRALLFVCVVACVCCLFPAAAPSGVCDLGCRAVCCLSPPLCAVLCCAVLVPLRCTVRVVCAVSGAWCCGALLCVVLFPLVCCCAVLGLVARSCLLVACFSVGVRV